MLQRLLRRLRPSRVPPAAELRGRPPVRREKAYAADSGYVYQYFYCGYRPASRSAVPGKEFVFDCTSDRSRRFTVAIFASDASYEDWERSSQRELSATERYAIVKMRLFEIFDESGRIDADVKAGLSPEQVARQIETLDL